MAAVSFKKKLSLHLMLAIGVLGALSLLWDSGMLSLEWKKSVASEASVDKQNRKISLSSETLVDTQLPVEPSREALTGNSQTAIVFLKTHKTGGSAIQNMCLRYAAEHDLLLALPRYYNYFGHPKPFDKSMVAVPLDGRKYQVFAHHTRFNYENIKSVMQEGAVFFTIMREPTSLFESIYGYYSIKDYIGLTLEEFVSQDKEAMAKHNNRMPGNWRIGRNQMTFDLGGETENFENEQAIRKMAETLDQQFQLVMIMERMNESLVLLKHLLSWTTDDVVVLRLNARQTIARKELTPNLKEKILYWNNADVILYEYFFGKFDDKVKAFGEDRMRAEVQELQMRIDQWYSFCVAGVEDDTSLLAADIEGFQLANVDNKTCEYLVKQEFDFTGEMITKQDKLVSWY